VKQAFRRRLTIPWRAVALCGAAGVAWHLPLLWSAGARPSSTAEPRASRKEVYIVFDPAVLETPSSPFSWQDPTIYLFPSELSFSRGLHERRIEPKITPENPAPPSLILPLELGASGGPLSGEPVPTWLLASSADPGAAADATPNLVEATPASGSAWRVTGRIAERLRQARAALPPVHSPELLAPTVLRIGINPQGDPRFVMVETGSGLEPADDAAVRFARDLSFAPSDDPSDSPVSWGHLKIFWQADPPPAKRGEGAAGRR
jgi:hypothetical protein